MNLDEFIDYGKIFNELNFSRLKSISFGSNARTIEFIYKKKINKSYLHNIFAESFAEIEHQCYKFHSYSKEVKK